MTSHNNRLKDNIQAKFGVDVDQVTHVEPRPAEGGAFFTIEAINSAKVRELAFEASIGGGY